MTRSPAPGEVPAAVRAEVVRSAEEWPRSHPLHLLPIPESPSAVGRGALRRALSSTCSLASSSSFVSARSETSASECTSETAPPSEATDATNKLQRVRLPLAVPIKTRRLPVPLLGVPPWVSLPKDGMVLVDVNQTLRRGALEFSRLDVGCLDASGRPAPFIIENPARALRPFGGVLGGCRSWLADQVASLEVDHLHLDASGGTRIVGHLRTPFGVADRAVDERQDPEPGGEGPSLNRELARTIVDLVSTISGGPEKVARSRGDEGGGEVSLRGARISLAFPDGPLELEARGTFRLRVVDPEDPRTHGPSPDPRSS